VTPQASPARAFPEPRADLGLREGYHSPQVPVEVRLNTNESPYPPPPEFLEALVAQVRDVAYNRYPDRLRRTRSSRLTAQMRYCSPYASHTGEPGEERPCSSRLTPSTHT
jgi:histidinol-phosphate/aromatic aminotransferase/cobyric acid decarboxylase-like protein